MTYILSTLMPCLISAECLATAICYTRMSSLVSFMCSEILLETWQPIWLTCRSQYGYTCTFSATKTAGLYNMPQSCKTLYSTATIQWWQHTLQHWLQKFWSHSHCFPTRVPQNIVRGSTRNCGINNFEISLKIPNIQQNVTGIFVWQLAILESSLCATNCFFVLVSV